jgi:hypothetical protein
MALYALYYYYPFKKRIALDEKIFRAGDVMAIDRVKHQWREKEG